MDAIFSSIGSLLGAFKDPTQIVLLLVAIAEGVIIYKLGIFFFTRYQDDIESRLKAATAFDNLAKGIDKLSERVGNAKAQ